MIAPSKFQVTYGVLLRNVAIIETGTAAQAEEHCRRYYRAASIESTQPVAADVPTIDDYSRRASGMDADTLPRPPAVAALTPHVQAVRDSLVALFGEAKPTRRTAPRKRRQRKPAGWWARLRARLRR